jgi:heme exporter protein A
MLEATRLVVWRGEREVLTGVSLSVPAGGLLIVQGPNGAGKSTLLRVLAGLVPPLAGQVVRPERFVFVGHADGVKSALTVAENLAFAAALLGGDSRAALGAFALEPLAALPARHLSAGQRRRLALARLALAPVPLWLLDEPTVGLDAASVARFGELLAAHRAAGGAAAIASHIPLPAPDAAVLALA